MAMEEILDSVRRIVYKWVNTISRIQTDITAGDYTIPVKNARRFRIGDQVMLKNNSVYETGLNVSDLDYDTHIVTLSTPALNNWLMSDNTVLIKTINEQFVNGIYIGDPDVIVKYPAITVNGISRSSEWMTLESSKERFTVEVTVMVQASTHENGYRFLLKMADAIQLGLKRNIMPLISDYNVSSLIEDAAQCDKIIRVADRSLFNCSRRIILEDEFESAENIVTGWFDDTEDPAQNAIQLHDQIPFSFSKEDTSVIVPNRFVYNSWPNEIQYGTIHKGELLKAAKISWFAEEEELQHLRRMEPKLR